MSKATSLVLSNGFLSLIEITKMLQIYWDSRLQKLSSLSIGDSR